MLDRLDAAVAFAKRYGTQLAVLFVDLDKFKEINDVFGHAVGDLALTHVAQCLSSSVRAADTVSRLGGDEFVVLLTEVSNGSDAKLVGQKILDQLGAPCQIGTHLLRLSASIGISLYPAHAQDAATLVERADTAMYRAKRNGAGQCVSHGDSVCASDSQAVALHGTAPGHLPQTPLAPSGQASLPADLQAANEQLLLAALHAQELQEVMQDAQSQLTAFLVFAEGELRNPQAPNRLAADQLRRLPSDEALLPLAQALVETQAAHMTRLVTNLLDMSRRNPSPRRFERTPVNVLCVVERAIKSMESITSARSQKITPLGTLGPLGLLGSSAHLQLVLSDLLYHASRHTQEGGVIEVTTAKVGEQIVITVKDEGLGMTDEALLKVFEPVVPGVRALGVQGLGSEIGLVEAKQWVEAHGGTVVASSPGQGLGCQFVVTLPLSAA